MFHIEFIKSSPNASWFINELKYEKNIIKEKCSYSLPNRCSEQISDLSQYKRMLYMTYIAGLPTRTNVWINYLNVSCFKENQCKM